MRVVHEAAVRQSLVQLQHRNTCRKTDVVPILRRSAAQIFDVTGSEEHMYVCHTQTLREEKQTYEKEMVSMRARYEEDAVYFKEAQTRALEDLSKKHRTVLETTQVEAEREKNHLLEVSSQGGGSAGDTNGCRFG